MVYAIRMRNLSTFHACRNLSIQKLEYLPCVCETWVSSVHIAWFHVSPLTGFYDYTFNADIRTSNSSLSKSALIGEGLIAEHMRCCKEKVLLPSELLAWWLRICLRLSCLLHSTRAAFKSPRVICCCLNCDVSTISPAWKSTLIFYLLKSD